MMREVLDQNDQMRETLGKLMDERDSLAAQLEATQASLDAATADVGALMQMNQDLNDEKEALLGAAEEGHQVRASTCWHFVMAS